MKKDKKYPKEVQYGKKYIRFWCKTCEEFHKWPAGEVWISGVLAQQYGIK